MAEGAKRVLGRELVGGIVVGPPWTVAPAGLYAARRLAPAAGRPVGLRGPDALASGGEFSPEVLPLIS